MSKHIFKKGDRVEYTGLETLFHDDQKIGWRGVVVQVSEIEVVVVFEGQKGVRRAVMPTNLKLVENEHPAPNTDLTIRQLQTNLPWSIRYSRDFRASPITHKDFAHALTHVGKASGFLHALVDDMDHDRSVADDSAAVRERAEKYIADLVICALRMANTLPGGVLDLQRAVQHRIESKNGVKLPTGD